MSRRVLILSLRGNMGGWGREGGRGSGRCSCVLNEVEQRETAGLKNVAQEPEREEECAVKREDVPSSLFFLRRFQWRPQTFAFNGGGSSSHRCSLFHDMGYLPDFPLR